MKKIPRIEELMTPFNHTIQASKSVKQAKSYMYQHDISHLPVIEDGEFVGVVTDQDIKLAQAVVDADHFDEKHRVGELCLSEPYVIPSTARADKILSEMGQKGLDCALIMKNDKLVGLFTATDACRFFLKFLVSQLGTDDVDKDGGA
jgi:acetoin utilization protein AcuB